MSTFGNELIGSALEAVDMAPGKSHPARLYEFAAIDVAALRSRLGLSQTRFAEKYGLSVATIRDWEQGRRQPDQTARTLLRVIDRKPDLVAEVLKQHSTE